MRKWIVLTLCIIIGIAFAFDDAIRANLNDLVVDPTTYDPEVLGILEEISDTASPICEPFLGYEPIQLGTTCFDYQHNSTLGRNIAVDDDGGVHVCWMKSTPSSPDFPMIYYSYIDPSGEVLSMAGTTGIRCDYSIHKAGFSTIDTHGCSSFIAYHETNSSTADHHYQVSYDVIAMDTDCLRHGGFADCDPFPPMTYFPEDTSESIENIWPVISVSQFDGDIHIISTSNSSDTTLPHYCVYNHGIVESSEIVFRETGVPLHDVYEESPTIATANSRDEIAVAFIDYKEDYTCTWVDGMNIILMTSTDDGESWDTSNVTNNTGDFRDIPLDTIYYDILRTSIDPIFGDTTYTPGYDTSVFYSRPSGGLSLFYDNHDFIHITWTESVYPNIDSCTGSTVISQPRSDIKHWTNRTGGIKSVLGGRILKNNYWPGGDESNPRNNYSSYSPNGACSDDGTIYIIWQQYFGELYWEHFLPEDDSSTVLSDLSEDGYANQEIFINYSDDYGFSWYYYPLNLSNTYTPGCESGSCHSELDPTIARFVDDKIHLFWVDDLNPGIVEDDSRDSIECPVMYVGISIYDFPRAIEEKTYHVGTPEHFGLATNYPNPFNMATEIAFSIEKAGNYAVEVYDLEGKLVKILANNYMAKGEHITAWNGTDMSGTTVTSGLYLYRIRDDRGNSIVRTMSFVK